MLMLDIKVCKSYAVGTIVNIFQSICIILLFVSMSLYYVSAIGYVSEYVLINQFVLHWPTNSRCYNLVRGETGLAGGDT